MRAIPAHRAQTVITHGRTLIRHGRWTEGFSSIVFSVPVTCGLVYEYNNSFLEQENGCLEVRTELF
jgi:hypothetical protein